MFERKQRMMRVRREMGAHAPTKLGPLRASPRGYGIRPTSIKLVLAHRNCFWPRPSFPVLHASDFRVSPNRLSRWNLRQVFLLPMVLAAIHACPEFCRAEANPDTDDAIAVNFVAGQQTSSNLLTSYSDDSLGLAHLFDQALGLIALSHAGMTDASRANSARLLAGALISLQDVEDKVNENLNLIEADFYGNWPQTYVASDASVDDAHIVTGPNAWAAYALWVYATLLDPPDATQAKLAALRFARYAIDFLRPLGYDYQFSEQAPTVFSTEHNLDMFWLLNSLGDEFDHETHTLKWWAQQLYFNELISPSRGYWSVSKSRWNRGSTSDGQPEDACRPSDVQTWGSITSLYAGDLLRQQPTLDYLLDPGNGLLHTELSFPTDLCGIRDLVGIEDNAQDGLPSQTIWNEGSAHALSALFYAGRDTEGQALFDSFLSSKWDINGSVGWPHSITSSPASGCHAHFGPTGVYGLGNHVGASSWAYFAIRSSEGDGLPFISLDAPFVVWADFEHTGTEIGNFQLPFKTLIDAVAKVAPRGTLKLKSGTTSETLTISKPLRMEAVNGTVRIG